MKTFNAMWFESTVAYEKVNDDGKVVKVKEDYLVDALSFAEGENGIIDEFSQYISGEFTVEKMKKSKIGTVILADNDKGREYYRVVVEFVTVDEVSGKEKKTKLYYLVQSLSIEDAVGMMQEHLISGIGIGECRIIGVSLTGILDVFRHKPAIGNDKGE